MSCPSPELRDLSAEEYRCPGAEYTIPRAVHLARLARFDPACRACPRRCETEGLPERILRQRAEVEARPGGVVQFSRDGLSGVWPNELGPAECRQAGQAIGAYLGRLSPCPRVLMGGNAAPHAPEALAAVGGGLRWAGCDVVELDPVTAGALAWAVARFEAELGILVGTPGHRRHVAGLTLLPGTAASCALGDSPDLLQRRGGRPVDRPTRTFGSHRREAVGEAYLAGLAERYHGLRPLGIVLDTPCRPLIEYLQKLTAQSACRIVEAECRAADPPRHLAAQVDGNGQTCQVFDERGTPVEPACLKRLLAGAGPSGPDALATITGLLVLLSQSDRPLSELVDAARPGR